MHFTSDFRKHVEVTDILFAKFAKEENRLIATAKSSCEVLHGKDEPLKVAFFVGPSLTYREILLGSNVRPLLHERAPVMPKTVMKGKQILKFIGVTLAGVWRFPLIRGKSANNMATNMLTLSTHMSLKIGHFSTLN